MLTQSDNQYISSDFSSYTDIWSAVTQLYRVCTVGYGVPGWVAIGMNNNFLTPIAHNPRRQPLVQKRVGGADGAAPGDASSTGVFLYASNTTIDEQFNATEPDTRISDHMPDGWSYLGCNYDTSNRALKNLSWSGENLSVERCALYCRKYQYFGVEFGDQWVFAYFQRVDAILFNNI